MNLSELAGLFAGVVSASTFSADLTAELAEYRRGRAIRGRSAPVLVTEDQDLWITRENIRTLCELFITGHLTQEVLAYTADAMQLAERVDFQDEWIADVVAEFTDPEIEGIFTIERAREIAASRR